LHHLRKYDRGSKTSLDALFWEDELVQREVEVLKALYTRILMCSDEAYAIAEESGYC